MYGGRKKNSIQTTKEYQLSHTMLCIECVDGWLGGFIPRVSIRTNKKCCGIFFRHNVLFRFVFVKKTIPTACFCLFFLSVFFLVDRHTYVLSFVRSLFYTETIVFIPCAYNVLWICMHMCGCISFSAKIWGRLKKYMV